MPNFQPMDGSAPVTKPSFSDQLKASGSPDIVNLLRGLPVQERTFQAPLDPHEADITTLLKQGKSDQEIQSIIKQTQGIDHNQALETLKRVGPQYLPQVDFKNPTEGFNPSAALSAAGQGIKNIAQKEVGRAVAFNEQLKTDPHAAVNFTGGFVMGGGEKGLAGEVVGLGEKIKQAIAGASKEEKPILTQLLKDYNSPEGMTGDQEGLLMKKGILKDYRGGVTGKTLGVGAGVIGGAILGSAIGGQINKQIPSLAGANNNAQNDMTNYQTGAEAVKNNESINPQMGYRHIGEILNEQPWVKNIADETIKAFPFEEVAKKGLTDLNYRPFGTLTNTKPGIQGEYKRKGQDIYDTVEKIVPKYAGWIADRLAGLDTPTIEMNKGISEPVQQVMAHEMLHHLFESRYGNESPMRETADGLLNSWESNWDTLWATTPLLKKIDAHIEKNYDVRNPDIRVNERFAYLGQEAINGGIKSIPQPLRTLYVGIIKDAQKGQ